MSLFKKKPKPTVLKSKSSFEKRNLIGILLIVIALIMCFVLIPMLNNSRNHVAMIAIATEDIKKGNIISAKEITLTQRGTYGLKGYITKKDDVIGKPATVDILKNDEITSNKIGKDNISRLQSIINAKKTLTTISIKSNAAGLASHLKAGDIVKVYGVIEDEYSGSTLMQDPTLDRVEVYDIENSDTQSIDSKETKPDVTSGKEKVASTITFITTQQQEQALLKAEYNGSIHVVFVER